MVIKTLHKNELRSMQSIKIQDPTMMQKLTKSIEQFGLLKALTVVHRHNLYYIIDGNRIFEAGKACDINYFPCIIVETEKVDYLRCALNIIIVENDSVELCRLLQRLDDNDICKLPFDEFDRETIKTINEFDWNQYHKKTNNQLSLL